MARGEVARLWQKFVSFFGCPQHSLRGFNISSQWVNDMYAEIPQTPPAMMPIRKKCCSHQDMTLFDVGLDRAHICTGICMKMLDTDTFLHSRGGTGQPFSRLGCLSASSSHLNWCCFLQRHVLGDDVFQGSGIC
jgi:hypothetical protein